MSSISWVKMNGLMIYGSPSLLSLLLIESYDLILSKASKYILYFKYYVHPTIKV